MLRSLALFLFVVSTSAQLLGKYYAEIDHENKDCVMTNADGTPAPFDWRWDNKLDFSADDWQFGSRGQKNKFCVEWTGSISGGAFLNADADDGVRIWVNGQLSVDMWNSYDDRGCQHLTDGCPGNGAVRIVYYQDHENAHFHLYGAGSPAAAKKSKTLVKLSSSGASAPTGPEATAITDVNQHPDCCYDTDATTAAPCAEANRCRSQHFVPYQIARIGEVTEVWRSTFWNGRGADGSAFYYIKQCTDFMYVGYHGGSHTGNVNNNMTMNWDQVAIEVEMGENKDYFMPLPGKTLCDMLMSNKHHLWSSSGDPNTFIKPSYSGSNTHLGGSAANWPRNNVPNERRIYLPYWGGNNANGGCCHNAKAGITWEDDKDGNLVAKDEASAWNRMAHLRVFAQPWKWLDPASVGYVTNLKKGVWTPYSYVSGTWNLADKPWEAYVAYGYHDQPEAIYGGYYFMRGCLQEWEDLEENVNVCMCTSSRNSDALLVEECGKIGTADASPKVQCDIYRPAEKSNLCDMLVARDEHEWWVAFNNDTNDKGNWVKPDKHNDHFGGSANGWPNKFCEQAVDPDDENSDVLCADERTYLPFWGGYRGGYGRAEQPDANVEGSGRENWSRDYKIWITKA